MKQSIALKIGGAAGQGVKTAGYILTKALKSLGWWTFSYSEYPSLIRGGHSTFQIDISDEKIHSSNQIVDILVALNEETINLHYEEIAVKGLLLYGKTFEIRPRVQKALEDRKIQLVQLPLEEIVKKNKGLPVMENSVMIGGMWAILTSEYKFLENQVKSIFGKKAKNIETNLACTKGGFDHVRAAVKIHEISSFDLDHKESEDRIIGTGNEVAGLSVYASGCRVYCAYPMTPSTGILQYLAQRTDKTGIIVKQAEDEITAIQMTIGASFAGTRSACGTSGGGLALMTESLALAGITETPLVVFNSQRPGPATGVPTWTEQGDLSFVSRIGHGEFPRIILAPGDIDEVFSLVPEAFNLAEKYQTLVIILLDKYLSESWYQTKKFKDTKIKVQRGQILSRQELASQIDFKRYKFTVSGISPRSLPGSKRGVFLANSDEHDEKGYSTEDLLTRKQMMEKRMRKVQGIMSELPEPKLLGPKNARTTIVCWGSQKGPILDALKDINAGKSKVNMLHYTYVYPVKHETIKRLAGKNKLIAVENNYSAQLAQLIRAETGIEIKSKMTKYVGTPFFRDELVEALKHKV
ncbi:2-oxoacid:acceptor oxidoreductase subunit alpha [Candidatus Dojkabacteria bacterium]|nr:2-oxoacid:acceptor oxidoreductase subunit alpha [Candidatus Dojkabacteria bacterium]